MRRLLLCVSLLSACADGMLGGNPDGGGGAGGTAGAGGSGGGTGGSGGSCDADAGAPATCETQFSYSGTAITVELRGDFAPNAWQQGVPMAKNGDAFTVSLPLPNGRPVQYKFFVNGSQWLTDPGNPNTVPDGQGGVNSVVTPTCENPCGSQNGPFDWHDAVLYFALVDRFYDGDPTNDMPLPNIETPANYQGGDLEGVRQKIEAGYFDQLGINALWLSSPIDNTDNPGLGDDGHNYSAYHGYWPTHLDQVESKIGTLALLEQVVAAAHAHHIKVLLDYVMNHVHQDSPIYQQHHDWFNPSSCICGDACTCGSPGCSWDDPNLRKVCWFETYLPDWNFNVTDARNYSVGNAVMWIQQLGIDGFRLDAVKHIEPVWFTDLRSRVPTGFYMVGETFTGDRGLIQQFVNAQMLDGQFDFPLRAQVIDSILARRADMSALADFVQSNDSFYGPGAIMSTFLGNHDLPRVIHLAEDTPEFDTWDPGKGRAWSNQPQQVTSQNAYQRVAVAFAFLMTSPGVPLIYYGDEIGQPGAGDPDNRRPMPWSGVDPNGEWLRTTIAKLISIRAAHAALRRGTRTRLSASSDLFVYQMSTSGDQVWVALNRGDGTIAADGIPSGTYHELVGDQMLTTPIQLPPRSAFVLVQP